MKKHFLFFSLLCFMFGANAQKHLWQKHANNADVNLSSTGQDLEIDGAGNMYVLNGCGGITTIDGDTVLPIQPTGYNSWVGKFDKDGNKQWAVAMESGGHDTPFDMTLDDSANLYILVYFQNLSPITFQDTTVTLTSGYASALVKLDSSGRFQWLSQIPYFPSCGSFIAYSSGYIFLRTCAGIQRFRSIDGTQSGATIINNSLTLNSVVHKGTNIATNGDILFSFSSEGMTVNGVPLPNTPNAQGNGGDLHLLRIDTGMTVKSHKAYGAFYGRTGEYLNPLIEDDSGFIYTMAVTNVSQAFFGTDTITPFNALLDVVLLKMDSMFNPIKMNPLYRAGGHMAQDMIFANNGFYVVGRTPGTSEFPDGFVLPTTLNGDMMVLKFNKAGKPLWVKNIGYTQSGSDDARCIRHGYNNHLFISGRSSQGADLSGCLSSTNNGMRLVAMRDYLPIDLPVTNPTYIREGYKVFFNAGLSDGEFVSWCFGDSTSTTAQVNPLHVYNAPGYYQVILTTKKNCDVKKDTLYILYTGIQSITPNRAANSGYYLGHIKGGFPFAAATVTLKRNSFSLQADTAAEVNAGLIDAHFLFPQIDTGYYDVIVNSGSFTDTLHNGLYIELPNNKAPEIQVSSFTYKVRNVFYQERVTVTNNSNSSMIAVPVYISINDIAPNRIMMQNPLDYDSVSALYRDTLGSEFIVIKDSLTGDSLYFAAYIIPLIEPGQSKVISFLTRYPVLGRQVTDAYVGSPLFTDVQLVDMGLRSSCDFLPACFQCLHDILGFVPVVGCAAGSLNIGCEIGGIIRRGRNNDAGDAIKNLTITTIGGLMSCGGERPLELLSKITANTFRSLTATAAVTANKLNDITGTFGSCIGFTPLGTKPACDPTNYDDWTTFVVSSLDPNLKTGPVGNTADNYINNRNLLHYQIQFENVDTATAPAREVVVYDTLDVSKFDISTFQFTGFGFADYSQNFFVTDTVFARELDLRPAKDAYLRVTGILHRSQGIVEWRFSTYDTQRYDIVQNVMNGFLNPNINRPEGEGFVTYMIRPLSGLAHTSVIQNKAVIYFDNNAPIETPYWINTIDDVAPQSNVIALPSVINDTLFTAQWQGNDAHSGVATYDVFVTINDTLSGRIIHNASYTSAQFTGKYGDTYKFWTVARDHVGNIEDAPAQPDAVVTLQEPNGIRELNDYTFSIVPNPATTELQLSLTEATTENTEIVITNIAGSIEMRDVIRTGERKKDLNITMLPPGMHLVMLKNTAQHVVKSFVKE